MPLSLNALMRHLRQAPISMDIKGTRQKRLLKNLGYYHGYKGYRFLGISENRIDLTSFDDLVAVSSFDMELKSLIYPEIMFIETALKNYVLEAVLANSHSAVFEDVYARSMTRYREKDSTGKNGSKFYRDELRRRLRARSDINGILYANCGSAAGGDPVIWHFLEQGKAVPIWALFEELTLGQFGNFYLTLGSNVKAAVASDLGLPRSCDGGKILGNMIFVLKDLRNAIAHNRPIFDLRFKRENPGKPVRNCLQFGAGVTNVNFDVITDYIVLMTYLLRRMGRSKTDCKRFANSYLKLVSDKWNGLPGTTAAEVAGTDVRKKIAQLVAAL